VVGSERLRGLVSGQVLAQFRSLTRMRRSGTATVPGSADLQIGSSQRRAHQ
jgi:hypothetical protein